MVTLWSCGCGGGFDFALNTCCNNVIIIIIIGYNLIIIILLKKVEKAARMVYTYIYNVGLFCYLYNQLFH